MARGGADTRTFLMLLLRLVHGVDRLRRDAYYGDLDLAVVAIIVASAGVEHMTRQPDFRDRYGDIRQVVGADRQRGVNALSVADASGIPRETVRRKLKQLVAMGVLQEKTRGKYIMKPGFTQSAGSLAMVDKGLALALQFLNDSVALGVLRWTESGKRGTPAGAVPDGNRLHCP
jgi:hypothetical protein